MASPVSTGSPQGTEGPCEAQLCLPPHPFPVQLIGGSGSCLLGSLLRPAREGRPQLLQLSLPVHTRQPEQTGPP